MNCAHCAKLYRQMTVLRPSGSCFSSWLIVYCFFASASSARANKPQSDDTNKTTQLPSKRPAVPPNRGHEIPSFDKLPFLHSSLPVLLFCGRSTTDTERQERRRRARQSQNSLLTCVAGRSQLNTGLFTLHLLGHSSLRDPAAKGVNKMN